MLDGRLLVLKLVLEELGYDTDISTVEKRKRDQKAIYLTQVFGVDLGYRYGWYLMGPYSPGLARDYYALHGQSASTIFNDDRKLKNSLKEKIANVEELRTSRHKPEVLTDLQWLELLASWHYIRNISGKNEADASGVITREKPSLAPHIGLAISALEDSGL